MQTISKDWFTFPDFMIKVAWDKVTKDGAGPSISMYKEEAIKIILIMAKDMGSVLEPIITKALDIWLQSYENKMGTETDNSTNRADLAFWDSLSSQAERDHQLLTTNKRLRNGDRYRTVEAALATDSEDESPSFPTLPVPKLARKVTVHPPKRGHHPDRGEGVNPQPGGIPPPQPPPLN